MLTYEIVPVTNMFDIVRLFNVTVWLLISLKSLENQIWLLDLIND